MAAALHSVPWLPTGFLRSLFRDSSHALILPLIAHSHPQLSTAPGRIKIMYSYNHRAKDGSV